jgi:uncharacterized protein with von Willebrand factor type A (vWA) domain
MHEIASGVGWFLNTLRTKVLRGRAGLLIVCDGFDFEQGNVAMVMSRMRMKCVRAR